MAFERSGATSTRSEARHFPGEQSPEPSTMWFAAPFFHVVNGSPRPAQAMAARASSHGPRSFGAVWGSSGVPFSKALHSLRYSSARTSPWHRSPGLQWHHSLRPPKPRAPSRIRAFSCARVVKAAST